MGVTQCREQLAMATSPQSRRAHRRAALGVLGSSPGAVSAAAVLQNCVSTGVWEDNEDLNLSAGRPHGRSGAGGWLAAGVDLIVLGRG